MSRLTSVPWLAEAPRRVYLASSWRNPHQPRVLAELRGAGHEVYDFRNPAPGNTGFSWSAIDPNWQDWTPEEFAYLVTTHPVAAQGFVLDYAGMDWADTCVMLLPCGRSAHLEAGYMAGQGKRTIFVLRPEKFEPELMYLLGHDFALDDAEACIACAVLFKDGDLYHPDASGGCIHAECCGPERESYTGDDGGPLAPDEPIPQPLVWEAQA